MIKFTKPLALAAAGVLSIIGLTAGGTYALVSSTLPPGTYKGGQVQQCIDTAKPYTVHAHGGALNAPCPKGSVLANGPHDGAQGPAGKTGAASMVPGPVGPQGSDGLPGANGQDGKDAPAAAYGIGKVLIKRGTGSFSTWSTVSTPLGGPVGDTASQSFRMTCSSAQVGGCVIKAQAYATADGESVYPRILIQKSDANTGAPVGLCEYGDGSDNDGGHQSVGSSPADLHLGIGGSLDCGSDQVRPASGVVDEIDVPAGAYYDIAFSVAFSG